MSHFKWDKLRCEFVKSCAISGSHFGSCNFGSNCYLKIKSKFRYRCFLSSVRDVSCKKVKFTTKFCDWIHCTDKLLLNTYFVNFGVYFLITCQSLEVSHRYNVWCVYFYPELIFFHCLTWPAFKDQIYTIFC
jgi:hypothetical protein